MTSARQTATLPLMATGVPGLDQIGDGGIPAGRTTVIAGTSGSGKTVLALQFLAAGIRIYGENGVCCTFEEPPDDLVRNVASFDWAFGAYVEQGRLAIVDATQQAGEEIVESGAYDLSGLLVRIESAVARVGARRVILDAVGALFPQFADPNLVRRELRRVYLGLRALGVTTVVTMERTDEDGGLGRFGVEEFVADNVIVLRNRLAGEKRRRTIEILKFRGTNHRKGEHPFTIDSDLGVTIIPLSANELMQRSSTVRVSSGVAELDRMCGGGMYRDSIILVSGATGAGKTLVATEYLKAAIDAGERCILFGAEESAEQLRRNASAWGVDFAAAEERGLLRIICRYPEVMGLEDHTIQMKRDMERFQPARVVVDSLSAFERVSSAKSFREFVIGFTSHLKRLEITGLFTNTTSMLPGHGSITETHVSTITDTVILLRYAELNGEMRRGLTVLKMRGTAHDRHIREYAIDGTGLRIGEPLTGMTGILTGAPSYGCPSGPHLHGESQHYALVGSGGVGEISDGEHAGA